ncbi:UNKNOWN [Stylonychia lemnae]|uniref:HMG box domain-containing protein n=1 Tax=Stylonychia lemnae TaxID=5949 RepID=A0A077ZSA2_STYLE|nr:UNKNOWN [Stylonychia lemnae]|eukprot:CDW72757.1 UNKNOWN [Stylonychia lemnae]
MFGQFPPMMNQMPSGMPLPQMQMPQQQYMPQQAMMSPQFNPSQQNNMMTQMFNMMQNPLMAQEFQKFLSQQMSGGNQANTQPSTNDSKKTSKPVQNLTQNPPSAAPKENQSLVKKPRNSFIFFKEHIKNELMTECPGQAVCQLMALAGQKWKALSDEQKQQFQKMATDDVERYKKELNQEKSGQLSDPVGSIGTKPQNYKKKSGDQSQLKGEEFKKTNPGIKIQEITKQAAVEWKSLTDDQKSHYKQLADQKNASTDDKQSSINSQPTMAPQQSFQLVNQIGTGKRVGAVNPMMTGLPQISGGMAGMPGHLMPGMMMSQIPQQFMTPVAFGAPN